MELAARLTVLLACGVACGTLFVLAAAPGRAAADPPGPIPPAGLAPLALAAFIPLAGGTVLTGAGTIDAGLASGVLQAAGIGVLTVVGLLVAKPAVRVLRVPATAGAAVAPSASLLVLAWAGAALAVASWILAAGAVAVALLAGVRIERPR